MALFIKVTDVSGQSTLVNLDRVNRIYKDTYGGNNLDFGTGVMYVKEDFISNPELLTKNIV